MQSDFLDFLAWALILLGAILIVSGIAKMLMRSGTMGSEKHSESKGIILLGPIPIVWGYGKQVWVYAAIVALILFFIFWFL
ncbi:MAG: DUF131 domain-containing protein [Promethearchaeota archaeon]|jgi:uncharacterized protein (TIGR00304 family)